MLSLLVISDTLEKSKNFIQNFCEKEAIHSFDITFLESQDNIGVEEIREAQKKLYLKPLKGEKKCMVIINAHTATREAQNALLKVLEEPPANTQIILTATTTQSILPTILSRCKTIFLDETLASLSKDEEKKYQEEFEQLLSANIPLRLKYAQDFSTDKQQLQVWIKNMILSLRSLVISQTKYELAETILAFQEALNLLQTTNINARFLCENLLLNLPSSK